MRDVVAETHLWEGGSASIDAFLNLRLYTDGDLVLEVQVIGPSVDGDEGYDDAEFFTSVGPKDLPRLIVALVTDYFATVEQSRPMLEVAGLHLKGRPDREIRCVARWRTIKLRAKGRPWWLPATRSQTRILAFEMVRVAFNWGLFRDDSAFREWLNQKDIPWEFHSF